MTQDRLYVVAPYIDQIDHHAREAGYTRRDLHPITNDQHLRGLPYGITVYKVGGELSEAMKRALGQAFITGRIKAVIEDLPPKPQPDTIPASHLNMLTGREVAEQLTTVLNRLGIGFHRQPYTPRIQDPYGLYRDHDSEHAEQDAPQSEQPAPSDGSDTGQNAGEG